MIDMEAQYPEQAEVSGHHDQVQDPRHKRGQDAEERADGASADEDDPCDKCHTASDGVQDHGSSEAVGGASFDVRELCAVNRHDNVGRFIADVAA